MTRRARLLALLFVLVAAGTYFLSSNNLDAFIASMRSLNPKIAAASPLAIPADNSATLPFDPATKREIRRYIEGVTIDPKENNVGEAIHLDQAIGRPQLASGKYREAYQTYRKVLAISYRQASPMGIGIALNVMATVAQRANHPDEALATTLLAYKVIESLHDKQETGIAALAVARRLESMDSSLALMWLLRATDDLKDSGYKEDYVRALGDLAESLQETHQEDKASQVIAQAWDRAQALGDGTAQKWAKAEVARVYADDRIRDGDYDKAVQVLEAAQGVFTAAERSTDTYTGLIHRLARAQAGRPNAAEAGRDYLLAYANYELTRADAPGDEGRAFLDKNHKDLVDDFIAYHAQSKDYAAALALLETNKARTLGDVVEDPSYKEQQDQWKQMERRQAREISDLLQAPQDPLMPAQSRDLLPRLFELSRKHEDERQKLQAALQLKETIVAPGLSKEDVAALARRLPADVAVLSVFAAGKETSSFVATNRGIRYFAGLAKTEESNRRIRRLRLALTNPYNPFYREPAQWLYRHLVQPAVRSLPAGVKILVYSPDDLLSRIPLEVLMDGETFMGQRFAVYRIPSLRYARSIGAVKAAPARSGIACVDPEIEGGRLPFQQETGKALQTLYGKSVTPLVGKDCSESRLQAAIGGLTKPAFLHVGAHGNFYPANAMESAILLSGEEGANPQPWNARAMATTDMSRIDLVTLSSCEAGLTDPGVPRDVFGIARALFVAGAKSIVAPLWAVDDQAAAEHMRAFHTAYNRNVPAVFALQQAQATLRRTEKHRHPFYWSAFVLMGATR